MENLFIYGLFRDQARNLLGDFKEVGRRSVRGKIYKVNEFYPGFIPGEGEVWGELISVDENVLPALDEYEGYEYDRVRIKTSDGTDCWIYQYKFDISNFKHLTKGDWMLR
jgi:gamma-glutamylcyclotransferase (GGCT)/AIG2-like uncharacterized protein YtfP